MKTDELVNLLEDVAGSYAFFGVKDDTGRDFHCPSIIKIDGLYYAVYHTRLPNGNFVINQAKSTDLTNWTYLRTLVQDGDMPRLKVVDSWIVMTYEQYHSNNTKSTVDFKLFYDKESFEAGIIGDSYSMPLYGVSPPWVYNGTPNWYNATLLERDGEWVLDTQIGFHLWSGGRDVNGVTTILGLFGSKPRCYPSTAVVYNRIFEQHGCTGNIGGREVIEIDGQRWNIQEGNIGDPAGSWDKWRLFLYQYGDDKDYPTGKGGAIMLKPRTPGGSVSFANPIIHDVGPDLFLASYFIHDPGAAPAEAGQLLFMKEMS